MVVMLLWQHAKGAQQLLSRSSSLEVGAMVPDCGPSMDAGVGQQPSTIRRVQLSIGDPRPSSRVSMYRYIIFT